MNSRTSSGSLLLRISFVLLADPPLGMLQIKTPHNCYAIMIFNFQNLQKQIFVILKIKNPFKQSLKGF